MTILRHSRIGLTMDTYTQGPDKTTRDALKRLSDLVGVGPQNMTDRSLRAQPGTRRVQQG